MQASKNMERYILLLNKKQISLLKWENRNMREIRDGIFPVAITDDYEYSKPSLGTSYGYAMKSFEKDKSSVEKERFLKFLHAVNKNLKSYLKTNCILFLVGTAKARTDFKRISDYNHLIGGEISGSFSADRLAQLKQSLSKQVTNAALQ